MKNILSISSAGEFRKWLEENSQIQKECFIKLKRGKPDNDNFYYLDAVEVALCFGWIDSTVKKINGESYQRFSPRKENGNWTALNIERVKRLQKMGLMTEKGLKVCKDLNKEFKIEKEILEILKKEKILEIFLTFPELYQKIRCDNLMFYIRRKDKKQYRKLYEKALKNFIEKTKQGKMYGNWNDYGRLLKDY